MLFFAFLLLPIIFFFVFNFCYLINMYLGVFLFGFILYETVCASFTWVVIYFPILSKISTIISSNIFSYLLFFSSSFRTPKVEC